MESRRAAAQIYLFSYFILLYCERIGMGVTKGMSLNVFFLFPVATGVIVFLLYFLTAFRDVPGGDAGELLAEGCAAGVAHPPGYPLYTMILWLVTSGMRPLLQVGRDADLLEFPGAPAWRANVLSCVFGAVAAGFLCATVQIWSSLLWAMHFFGRLF